MMSHNENLYEEAMDAIRKLFEDQTVGPDQARENLQGLIDEIRILIDGLPEEEL